MPILTRPEAMERITTPALAERFIAEQIEDIRAQVGENKVLLALSGGVDSSVVAALLIRAIGKQLVCVHVNHGLLRKGEPEQVIRVFKDEMDANLIYVDAVDRFLDKLAGVSDPETKRKIIGGEFIEVFADEEIARSRVNCSKNMVRRVPAPLDITARRRVFDVAFHCTIHIKASKPSFWIKGERHMVPYTIVDLCLSDNGDDSML